MDNWFQTWITALQSANTTVVAFETGTVVSWKNEDLVMLDSKGEAVAIVAM